MAMADAAWIVWLVVAFIVGVCSGALMLARWAQRTLSRAHAEIARARKVVMGSKWE